MHYPPHDGGPARDLLPFEKSVDSCRSRGGGEIADLSPGRARQAWFR